MTGPLDGRRDVPLVVQALTHDSYAHEHAAEHNERLEFLGDAVLQLVTSEALYVLHPDRTEEELTNIRKSVVRNRRLAEVAEQRGVAEAVRVGRSLTGAARRKLVDVHAGAYEAVLGALYLTEGVDAVRTEVEQALGADLVAGRIQRDPLNELQEWHQKRFGTTPDYHDVDMLGADHEAVHVVELRLPPEDLSIEGRGAKKQEAKREAARAALELLAERGLLDRK